MFRKFTFVFVSGFTASAFVFIPNIEVENGCPSQDTVRQAARMRLRGARLACCGAHDWPLPITRSKRVFFLGDTFHQLKKKQGKARKPFAPWFFFPKTLRACHWFFPKTLRTDGRKCD
jgi:hypothetical protein